MEERDQPKSRYDRGREVRIPPSSFFIKKITYFLKYNIYSFIYSCKLFL